MTTTEVEAKKEIPADAVIATREAPKYYAVVKRAQENTDVITNEIISAENQRELKDKLSSPDVTIVAVFRGRKLKIKESRQVAFSI